MIADATLVAVVTETVMSCLSARHDARGGQTSLSRQTAIFDTGLLDSLALVELVEKVESRAGCTVDMLSFDPSAVHTAQDLIDQLSASLVDG